MSLRSIRIVADFGFSPQKQPLEDPQSGFHSHLPGTRQSGPACVPYTRADVTPSDLERLPTAGRWNRPVAELRSACGSWAGVMLSSLFLVCGLLSCRCWVGLQQHVLRLTYQGFGSFCTWWHVGCLPRPWRACVRQQQPHFSAQKHPAGMGHGSLWRSRCPCWSSFCVDGAARVPWIPIHFPQCRLRKFGSINPCPDLPSGSHILQQVATCTSRPGSRADSLAWALVIQDVNSPKYCRA